MICGGWNNCAIITNQYYETEISSCLCDSVPERVHDQPWLGAAAVMRAAVPGLEAVSSALQHLAHDSWWPAMTPEEEGLCWRSSQATQAPWFPVGSQTRGECGHWATDLLQAKLFRTHISQEDGNCKYLLTQPSLILSAIARSAVNL